MYSFRLALLICFISHYLGVFFYEAIRLPLLLFISRILSRPADDFDRHRSVLEKMFSVAGRVIGDGFPPKMLQEILSSPSLAFVLFLLFIGTALPSRENRGVKGGWLILVICFSFISAIAQSNSPSLRWYLGTVFMLLALYLMKHDVRKYHSDFVLVKALKSVKDSREYRASIRICKASLENRGIPLPAALDIVQEVYDDYSCTEVGYIAETICTRLIERHGLLALIHEDVKQLVPTSKFRTSVSGFHRALLFPRDLIVFGFCLLWVVSPLDAIPDFMPIIGVLDDVIVAYIGAWGLRGVFSEIVQQKKRFADHMIA